MNARNVGKVIFVLFVCFGGSFALYEDEVGAFDWYKENVGGPKNVLFHSTPSRKNLFVSTDSSTVGALSMKTGEIVWRQVLEEGETIDTLLELKNRLFSVSGNGKFLRMWDLEGNLVWEDVVIFQRKEGSSVDAVVLEDSDGDGIEEIAVLSHNQLQLRSGKDGKLNWSKQRGDIEKLVPFSKSFFGIGFNNDKKGLHIVSFDSSGSITKEKEFVSDSSFVAPFVTSGTRFFCMETSQNLFTVDLSTESSNHFEVKKLFSSPIEKGEIKLVAKEVLNGALLQLGATHFVVLQLENGAPKVSKEFKNGEKIFSSSETLPESNQNFLLAASSTDKNILLELLNLENGEVEDVKVEKENVGVKSVFLNVFLKKDGGKGHRITVRTEDDMILFIQDSALLWEREESLSSIQSSLFFDLPTYHASNPYFSHLEESSNIVEAFIKRLISQQKEWMEFFGKSEETLKISSNDTTIDMTKDGFGFRKLIIVATKAGKVFALHTETGLIVWKQYFPKVSQPKLFIIRESSHYPPQLLLVYKKENAKFKFVYLNPLNGDVAGNEEVNVEFVEMNRLPLMDSDSNHILMALDSSMKVHIFPSTATAMNSFLQQKNSIFFHHFDTATHSLCGYSIGDKNGEFSVSANELWRFAFAVDEKVIATTHAPAGEVVQSAGRATGDKHVYPKYLNRNSISIITEKESQRGPQENILQFYLIDTITGSLLHHHIHERACGPVQIVQSENWVVYHYWNGQNHQYEVIAFEFYEKYLDWEGNVFSSWNSTSPVAVYQSFVFPFAVNTLGVTLTAKGITTKNVLVGMSSGQILAVSRAVLDPRRPPKNQITQADKEEGILPFEPLVPVNPRFVISYYRRIHQLKEIQTSPAILESTTLVFAHGLDLFYTRLAPSDTFDILDPSFNHYLLILTSATLFVFTVGTFYLSNKREVARLWK